ncbi:MAG TPA: hypothetical protein PKX92_10165 [Edaphocola sp.]|nr:hypothetical protein [Edaphocola sp.]
MDIKKKFPLPEFVLLDGENHLGEQLLERTVVLHIPTATLLEVVSVEPSEVATYKELKHFPFVFTNIDGDDEHHLLILQKTGSEKDLEDVFSKAAQWYGNYCNWLDEEVDHL